MRKNALLLRAERQFYAIAFKRINRYFTTLQSVSFSLLFQSHRDRFITSKLMKFNENELELKIASSYESFLTRISASYYKI